MPISGVRTPGSNYQAAVGSIDAFIESIKGELAGSGIHIFAYDKGRQSKAGYTRVFFSSGANAYEADFYLDLKLGGVGPGGTTVFADTKKSNTPFPVAYSQLQVDPDNVRNSSIVSSGDTFVRYIRALYRRAGGRKTPQELIWTVAQEGDQREGLAGLKQFVQDDDMEPNRETVGGFPAIIQPSSVQALVEKVSRQVPVIGKFKNTFSKDEAIFDLLDLVDRGLLPGNLEQIRGYTLTAKGMLTPAAQWMRVVKGEHGERVTELFHERGTIEKQQKSPSMEFMTGEAAQTAYTRTSAGSYRFLEPQKPVIGFGKREGFVQSLFTMPMETTARSGIAAMSLLTDLPESSGGVLSANAPVMTPGFAITSKQKTQWNQLASSNAYMILRKQQQEAKRTGGAIPDKMLFGGNEYAVSGWGNSLSFHLMEPVSGMGTETRLLSDLGISTLKQFETTFGTKGKPGSDVAFWDLSGKTISPSRGSKQIGTLGYGPDIIKEKDVPEGTPQLYDMLLKKLNSALADNTREYADDQIVVENNQKRYRAFGTGDARTFREIVPITVKKRDYELIGHKTQVYVPEFRDPETGNFYNVHRSNFVRNDDLVKQLKEQHGDSVDILPFAGGGSGEETSPAGMYAVVPTTTATQLSFKGMSKAGLAPSGLDKLNVLVEYGDGDTRNIQVQYINPEVKMFDRMGIAWAGMLNTKSARWAFANGLPNNTPGEKAGTEAVLKYLDENEGNLLYNSDQMASIWRKHTKDSTTTQQLFGGVFKTLANMPPEMTKKLLDVGIAIPTEQDMKTALYSQQSRELLEKIIKDEGAAEYVGFENVPGSDTSVLKVRVPGRKKQGTPSNELFVPSLAVNFINFARPEITSRSPYVNASGVMSMIENQWGKPISALLGLSRVSETINAQTGQVERSYVPRGITGTHAPASAKAWFGMFGWSAYQKELSQYQTSIPKSAIHMTQPLAGEILRAIDKVSVKGRPDEEVMDRFLVELDEIQKNTDYVPKEKSLLNDMIAAPELYSLIPAANWIQPVESYKKGLQGGKSQTYLTKQYMNYLKSVAQSVWSSESVSMERVASSRNLMLGRIQKAISGSGVIPEIGQEREGPAGGKQFRSRNITGSYVPGKTSERYQEAGWVKNNYQVVLNDNDLLAKALDTGMIKDRSEWAEMKKWLDTNPDAYIPELAKRQPDVSATYEWIPVKTVSRTHAKNFMGADIDEGMGMAYQTLVSPLFNRIFVGDKDFDIKESVPLPMKRRDDGTWGIDDPEAAKAFNEWFGFYDKAPSEKVSTAMGEMFGESASEFDIGVKTIKDFLKSMTGKTSLQERSEEAGWWSGDVFRMGTKMLRHWKSGMARAYNMRRMFEVVNATQDMTRGDQKNQEIWRRGIESMSYDYQIYLDKLLKSAGGYSVLETIASTITMSPTSSGKTGVAAWGMRFMKSLRGKTKVAPRQSDWTDDILQEGWTGKEAALNPLFVLAGMASESGTQEMPNEKLAILMAQPGRQFEVYQALENRGTMQRKYVLQQLARAEDPAVGFESPGYQFLAFHSVKRLTKKHPALVDDPSYAIPWGPKGEFTPVSEIMQSESYQYMNLLTKLMMGSAGDVTTQELMMIDKLKKTKMGQILQPVHEQFMTMTGGAEPRSQQQIDIDVENMQKNIKVALGSQKRVHASELGNLASYDRQSYKGWTVLDDMYKEAEGFKVVARHLGFGWMFGDRESPKNLQQLMVRNVSRQNKAVIEGTHVTSVTEPIDQGLTKNMVSGNVYEEQYARLMKKGNVFHYEGGREGIELHHIGQTDTPLEYKFGELTIAGTPDFMGYEKDSNSIVIVDTKFAIDDPNVLGSKSMKNVKAYKNRLQQIAYAYGLQKVAREGTEDEWLDLMMGTADEKGERSGGWKMKDKDKVLAMRLSAAEGKFKLFLQPGHVSELQQVQRKDAAGNLMFSKSGKPVYSKQMVGNVETYEPIPIDFGQESIEELEGIGKAVGSQLFSSRTIRLVADEIMSSMMETPVKGSSQGVPRSLKRSYTSLGIEAHPYFKKLLNASILMSDIGRAGGGPIGDGESFTVGEGGPERIIRKGNRLLVEPNSQSPEARARRGEGIGGAGFTDMRFEGGGETPIVFFGNDPDSEDKKKRKEQQSAHVVDMLRRGSVTARQVTANSPSETASASTVGLNSLIPFIKDMFKEMAIAIPDKLAQALENYQGGGNRGGYTGGGYVSGRGNPNTLGNMVKIDAGISHLSELLRSYDIASQRFQTGKEEWALGASEEEVTQFSGLTFASATQHRSALPRKLQTVLDAAKIAGGYTKKEAASGIRAIEASLKLSKSEGLATILSSHGRAIPDISGSREAIEAAELEAFGQIQSLGREDVGKIIRKLEGDTDAQGFRVPESLQGFTGRQVERLANAAGFGLSIATGPEMTKRQQQALQFEGLDPKYAKAINDTYSKLIESAHKLDKEQTTLWGTYKLASEIKKETIDHEVAQLRGQSQAIKKAMPSMMFEKVGDEEKGRIKDYATEIEPLLATGAISSEEYDMGKMYIESQKKLSEKLTEQKELEAPPFARGIQGFSRHLLGGWGIFYMGTLAGLGTEDMQRGYKESQMSEEAAYTFGSKYIGSGIGVGERTEQRFANLSASGGNIPWKAWRQFSGEFSAAGLSDISGAAMKGLGGAALGMYLGDLTATAGKEANIFGMQAIGKGLSAIAPALGLATMVGTLGFEQLAYQNAPIQTGISIASSELRARGYEASGRDFMAFAERAGASWKGLSAKPEPLSELFKQSSIAELKEGKWSAVVSEVPIGRDRSELMSPGMLLGGPGAVTGYVSRPEASPVLGYYYQSGQTKNWITADQAKAMGISSDISKEPYISLGEAEYEKWGKLPSTGFAGATTDEEMKQYLGYLSESDMMGKIGDRIIEIVDKYKENPEQFEKLSQAGKISILQTMVQGEKAFEPYAPEVAFSVAARWAGAGKKWNAPAMEEEMAAAQQGLGWEELGGKMAAAVKGASTTYADVSEMIDMIRDAQFTPSELSGVKGTFDFISQIPDMLKDFSESGNKEQYMRGAFSRYGAIAGTVAEQPFISTWNQYQASRAVGLSGTGMVRQMDYMQTLAAEGRIPSTQEMIRYQRNVGAERIVTNLAEGNIQDMMVRGLGEGRASEIAAMASAQGYRGQYTLQQMLAGNALYMTQASRYGVNMTGTMTAFGGKQVDMNTFAVAGQDLTGAVNGLGLFQRSLWQGTRTPEETAIRMLEGTGLDWRTAFGGQLAGAVGKTGEGEFGGTIVPGFEFMGPVGGQQYFQLRQMQIQRSSQSASLGNQWAGIQAQKAFTTGVGISAYSGLINPQTGTTFGFNTGPTSINVAGVGSFTSQGGGFWGMEDAQRALQRMQQQSNFQLQAQGMQNQRQQFYQNMAMNQQQTYAQRGWAQEDWATNERTRGMQWNWRLEDYQENIRFTTGRERRLGERQMRRETTLHDVESEQIEKQKDRQKEMWKMEDARFRIQKQQFEQNQKLQEEAFRLEKEFYQQRTELEDESVQMQRAYWVQQIKVQEGAIGAQAKYLKDMKDLQDAMLLADKYTADAKSELELLLEAIKTDLPAAFERFIARVMIALGEDWESPNANKTSGEGKTASPAAHGGILIGGQTYLVGENEPELITLGANSTATPFHRYRSNPWNAVVEGNVQSAQNASTGQVTVVVNLGNERLGRFVVNAVDSEINL